MIIIELSVNFHKEFTDYIAGSIKHVYYLNGAWDDRIIGPVSTEQRDSVPRKANIRMQDLRHNDYTTWRFPKD